MDANQTDWPDSIDRERRRARDRLALLLAATATGLRGAYLLLVAVGLLSPAPDLRRFVDDPRWGIFLGGPLVLADLVSALLLLLGGRPNRAWLARTLLLVTASTTGLGCWCVEHARLFGWNGPGRPAADDPLKVLVLRLIALIRVVTLAELAAVFANATNRRDPTPLRRAARFTAELAFLLWLLLALTHLDWGHLPPRWRNIRALQSYALLAGSILARGVSYGLVAILCGHAYATQTRPGRSPVSTMGG